MLGAGVVVKVELAEQQALVMSKAVAPSAESVELILDESEGIFEPSQFLSLQCDRAFQQYSVALEACQLLMEGDLLLSVLLELFLQLVNGALKLLEFLLMLLKLARSRNLRPAEGAGQ